MRKPSQEDVALAARARLEQLARELDRAGVTRLPEAPTEHVRPPVPSYDDLPAPAVVTPAGRHARPGRHAATRPEPPEDIATGGRWSRLLPETLQGRTALDAGGLRVVVLLVVLGVGLAAVLLTRSHSETVPSTGAASERDVAPLASVPSPSAAAGPSGTVAPSPGSAAASPVVGPVGGEGVVTVHVAGKVGDPGVVELPLGSRVVDALEEVGGARRGVDLSGLNLARVLVDGEQLLVGRAGDVSPVVPGVTAPSGSAGVGTTGALVSLNSADMDQLDTIPGVGPVTAQKILDWRAANGAFSALEELLEIDGIGEKTLAEIVPHVTL